MSAQKQVLEGLKEAQENSRKKEESLSFEIKFNKNNYTEKQIKNFLEANGIGKKTLRITEKVDLLEFVIKGAMTARHFIQEIDFGRALEVIDFAQKNKLAEPDFIVEAKSINKESVQAEKQKLEAELRKIEDGKNTKKSKKVTIDIPEASGEQGKVSRVFWQLALRSDDGSGKCTPFSTGNGKQGDRASSTPSPESGGDTPMSSRPNSPENEPFAPKQTPYGVKTPSKAINVTKNEPFRFGTKAGVPL